MNDLIPLIKCRQLTLGYGSKDLVRDMDYEVNVGDYLCIIGRPARRRSSAESPACFRPNRAASSSAMA
ncbi:hypothetical protein [Fibrobacter succinogenes]|uniref:hypothetical protein n=1 Tax=Fibrobacter succinogenes TaxID=833 RepID=UPI0026E9E91A|nr:hypothetical protein [Fibrobacter succinogenes]